MFMRVVRAVLCIALACGLTALSPNLLQRLLGDGNAQWLSERFSTVLREKNELIVYEIEITGQETVTQDAWLIGTVQKVEIPYTFHLRYAVDLSNASVLTKDDGVEVRLPLPQAKYPELIVDEDKVRKKDWLYPLTTERYAEIIHQLEEKLIDEYRIHTQYLDNAWNIAVSNLTSMFDSITQKSILPIECPITIVSFNE